MGANGFRRDYRREYDIHDPELAERWEEIVEDLHSDCPVSRSTVGEGYWVVNSADAVRACAQNWKAFSSKDGYLPNRPDGMPFWYPVECDPPFHDELREALNPHLTPKAVGRYEDDVRRFADQLIDAFDTDGEVELVKAYTNALPGLVFCALVAGMPEEDMPYLSVTLNNSVLGPQEGRVQAMRDAMDYMDAFMRKRSAEEPRGDIVDAILGLELEGYEWEDRTGTLSQLTLGGLGTSGHVLASAIHHLALHEDERLQLIEDPSLMRRAVDEFIRAFAPSPHDGRRAQEDIEVAGAQMKAGDFVLMGYGAASRDPHATEGAEQVKLDRFPNMHLAFGAGVHRCIGAHLARLQLRVGLEQFLTRARGYRLPDGFQPAFEMGITRSMIALPVILDQPPL
jgi:cytochrome P450